MRLNKILPFIMILSLSILLYLSHSYFKYGGELSVIILLSIILFFSIIILLYLGINTKGSKIFYGLSGILIGINIGLVFYLFVIFPKETFIFATIFPTIIPFAIIGAFVGLAFKETYKK